MKIFSKLVGIALFSLLLPWGTFAASADVMVVVNGNTEVNREAYNYIRKSFAANSLPYSLAATLNPSSVKAGQYKSVVVLNTGTPSGLDPVLQKFIASYSDKKGLYLVNLFQDRAETSVVPFQAASNPAGVDGVTAASTWMRPFTDNSGIQTMHQTWIRDLVKFLGRT
jgi:hypothetical protein